MGDFVEMFPEYISSIQLVEGENFAPDSVMQFKYSLGKRLASVRDYLPYLKVGDY